MEIRFSQPLLIKLSISSYFTPVLIIFSIFIASCNNLPRDLQSRKDAINTTYEELAKQEEKAYSVSDYQQLITDYTNLKNEIVSYTAECNRRGISKENKEIIRDINERISNLEGLSDKDNSYSSGSSSSSSSSSYGSKTCSWCGKSFSGTHYTHLGKMSPCQSSSSSNSIGTFCSMKCCSEARRSSCPSCR
jgi:hypothetical protein